MLKITVNFKNTNYEVLSSSDVQVLKIRKNNIECQRN